MPQTWNMTQKKCREWMLLYEEDKGHGMDDTDTKEEPVGIPYTQKDQGVNNHTR